MAWSQPQSKNKRQQRVKDSVYCILYNRRAVLRHLLIIEQLAAFIGNIMCINTATPQNERQHIINRASTKRQKSINTASIECQHSVNNFGCWILHNPKALIWHIPRSNLLAAVMSKRDYDIVTAPG